MPWRGRAARRGRRRSTRSEQAPSALSDGARLRPTAARRRLVRLTSRGAPGPSTTKTSRCPLSSPLARLVRLERDDPPVRADRRRRGSCARRRTAGAAAGRAQIDVACAVAVGAGQSQRRVKGDRRPVGGERGSRVVAMRDGARVAVGEAQRRLRVACVPGARALPRWQPPGARQAAMGPSPLAPARRGCAGPISDHRALQDRAPAPTDEYAISTIRPQTNGPTAPRRSERASPARNVGPRRTCAPTTRSARTAPPRWRAKSAPTAISPRRGCAVSHGSSVGAVRSRTPFAPGTSRKPAGRCGSRPQSAERGTQPCRPLVTFAMPTEPGVARRALRDEDVAEPEDADRPVQRAVAQPDVGRADAPRQRARQRHPLRGPLSRSASGRAPAPAGPLRSAGQKRSVCT